MYVAEEKNIHLVLREDFYFRYGQKFSKIRFQDAEGDFGTGIAFCFRGWLKQICSQKIVIESI